MEGSSLQHKKKEMPSTRVYTCGFGGYIKTVRALFLGASTIALVGASVDVFAQDQETTTDDFDVLEEVIITGSRIARTGYDAPTPLAIIDRAEIDQSGFASLSDVLLRMPSLAVGQGLGNASNSGSNVGATFLNLRGLGVERTLTLVDGKRRVPGSSSASSVDLSSIPPAMVERVEVVTGGASAVYGADAVTGVVNVILKHDYDGFGVSARGGVTEHGGADSQQISMYGGTEFGGDRGHINMAVSYSRTAELDGTQRSFSQGDNSIFFVRNRADFIAGDGAGGSIPDFITYTNPVQSFFAETGTFFFFEFDPIEQRDRWFVYTADPNLREQTHDVNPQADSFGSVFNAISSGGDGFDFTKYFRLRPEQETVNAISNLDYELTENVTVYAEVDFANTRSASPFEPNFHPADGDGITVTRDNPLIPADVQTFMDQRGLESLWVQRTHQDLGTRVTRVERNTVNALTGFKGKIMDKWDYDVFFQYGRQNISSRTSNTLIRKRYLQAIDVISDADTGNPVCRDVAARAEGCLPLAVLGSNDKYATPEALAYINHDLLRETRLSQIVTGAQITGDLFELPAGPVAMAAGVEYRRETLSFRDDGANVLGQLLLNNGSAAIDGSINVKEVFGELVIPVVADKTMMQSLDIEAAVRFSDYSTIGSTTAWKLGGSWSPVDDIRFRVTRARSVRAPTISDLFNPGLAGFSSINDPCDSRNVGNGSSTREANCAALGLANFTDPLPTASTKRIITGGNPDLQSETSNSLTVGAVMTPSFIPRLRLSVDYWNIDLKGAIQRISTQDILEGCVDGEALANAFCRLITRRADGVVDSIRATFINVGQMEASGVDFQANYQFDLEQVSSNLPGYMNINLGGTYLEKVDVLVDPTDLSSLLIEAGEVTGVALPKWRANSSITYTTGPVTVNWFINYIGAMNRENQPTGADEVETQFDRIGAEIYNNIFASYQLENGITLNGGVNNIFDNTPPRHPNAFTGAGGLYDTLGRSFFLGISVEL